MLWIKHALFWAALLATGIVFGQHDGTAFSKPDVPEFEGTINYSIAITGKNAKGFAADEPIQKMDQHYRKGDFIIQLYEGSFPTSILYILDSNKVYYIDAANKRYFLKDKYQYTKKDTIPIAVKKPEEQIILGHKCSTWEVTKGSETTTYYVSDKIYVDISHFKKKPRTKAIFLIKGLDGRIPLKTIRKTPDLTITTTATRLLPKALDIQNFRIPKDFKRHIRDWRR